MAISTRQVKNKRDSNGVLTGRPGTVYDVNIKYTAPNGEKKTYSKKGFPTKKEATQHEAEMKAKLHNPGQIASIASQRKQTVASYLNEWVESYARVNLRPSTYDGYKKTIANYINPYIGGVALNQLTPAMVDKMFQQIIDKGLKPSTAAGAKRVLSVALSHARKYRYIETNAAKDTLTKFGKSDKTPDPYTPDIRRDRTYGDSCSTDKKQIVARLKNPLCPVRQAFVICSETLRKFPVCSKDILHRQNPLPERCAAWAETDDMITHLRFLPYLFPAGTLS